MSADLESMQGSAIPTVADFAAKIRSYGDMDMKTVPAPKGAAELQAVLAAHKTWVESIVEPSAPIDGRRARLAGVDLRGVNFSRRDLRGVDFAGANLEGAIFQGCSLAFADFTGANLRHADFRGAKTVGAVLDGANLEGVLRDHPEV